MSGKKYFHIDPQSRPKRPAAERVVSERGRKELPPGTKGGENLKPDRHYEHKQHAFDSYCKKVLKYEAYNGYREISRRQKYEALFSELSEEELAQLAVYDRYSWEYTAFPKVREANAARLRAAIRSRAAVKKDGKWSLAAPSYDAKALAADPSLEISYLVAPPRMAYYEKVSRQIYGIYLKYVAPEDMVVYSIDEVFIDATPYLAYYNMAPHDLAKTMMREVLYTTGITATAGIGSNLYLAKLAMDITAKHTAPDKDGVRIAELNEESFRYLLWDHKDRKSVV